MSKVSFARVILAQGHENIFKVKEKSKCITMNWKKKHKDSCALTRKACPAKLGLTWATNQANVFHLGENIAPVWVWSKHR